MLSRLRGEEENGAENLVSGPTQDAVEQLIGAQRLEKEEELEEKVLGQNLLGGEVHVEEELRGIVREAMRQVEAKNNFINSDFKMIKDILEQPPLIYCPANCILVKPQMTAIL